jgi:hypothetical protein
MDGGRERGREGGREGVREGGRDISIAPPCAWHYAVLIPDDRSDADDRIIMDANDLIIIDANDLIIIEYLGLSNDNMQYSRLSNDNMQT